MEWYMGRTLTNMMINLGLDTVTSRAMYEVSWTRACVYVCMRLWSGWVLTHGVFLRCRVDL
jgi:hypothetical protein